MKQVKGEMGNSFYLASFFRTLSGTPTPIPSCGEELQILPYPFVTQLIRPTPGSLLDQKTLSPDAFRASRCDRIVYSFGLRSRRQCKERSLHLKKTGVFLRHTAEATYRTQENPTVAAAARDVAWF